MKTLLKPTQEQLVNSFFDITEPQIAVEIKVRDDKKVIWITVDGITVMRICRIPNLIVEIN